MKISERIAFLQDRAQRMRAAHAKVFAFLLKARADIAAVEALKELMAKDGDVECIEGVHCSAADDRACEQVLCKAEAP